MERHKSASRGDAAWRDQASTSTHLRRPTPRTRHLPQGRESRGLQAGMVWPETPRGDCPGKHLLTLDEAAWPSGAAAQGGSVGDPAPGPQVGTRCLPSGRSPWQACRGHAAGRAGLPPGGSPGRRPGSARGAGGLLPVPSWRSLDLQGRPEQGPGGQPQPRREAMQAAEGPRARKASRNREVLGALKGVLPCPLALCGRGEPDPGPRLCRLPPNVTGM